MNTSYPPKRLFKSRTERMIDGVCGGVAEYFNVDPTLVRIAWVLLTLFGGSGILLYIIAMIVIPAGPVSPTGTPAPEKSERSKSNHKFWGILLVVVGAVWLMSNLGLPLWRHWWGLSWDVGVPLVLILAGVAFLFGGRDYITGPAAASGSSGAAGAEGPAPAGLPPPAAQKLFRSRTDRKLFGVCGGLGNHLNVDPTIIRVLFIAGVFASFGFMVLLYIILAFVIPEEPAPVKA